MKMDMIGMVEKREVNLLIGKLTKKELAISQMNMLRRIFYANEGYLILPWSDYMVAPKPTFTKSDLKDGDFVLRRNGDIEIALPSLGAFVSDRGYMDFDSVADDLSHFDGLSPVSEDEDWDIIEVRRPSEVHHCQFDCFQNGWGEVVYERSEVVEMTMEEICEALGKKFVRHLNWLKINKMNKLLKE